MRVLYTTGHEHSRTPCDENSPYYRLIKEQGMILLLGVNQHSNTTLHCIEELAGSALSSSTASNRMAQSSTRIGVKHAVPNRLHLWGWERDFTKIDQRLT